MDFTEFGCLFSNMSTISSTFIRIFLKKPLLSSFGSVNCGISDELLCINEAMFLNLPSKFLGVMPGNTNVLKFVVL